MKAITTTREVELAVVDITDEWDVSLDLPEHGVTLLLNPLEALRLGEALREEAYRLDEIRKEDEDAREARAVAPISNGETVF